MQCAFDGAIVGAGPIGDMERAVVELRRHLDSSESGFSWGDELRRVVDERYPLWLLHLSGRIIEAGRTVPAFLGLDRPDQLLGRLVLDLLHPDDRPYAIERIAAAFGSGQPSRPALQRMLHAHGSLRVVNVIGIPVEYRGAPTMLAIGRDATLGSRGLDR